jgi:hypothetical protein
MKAFMVLIVLTVLCFLIASPVLAVVEFQLAPGYNFFHDARINGQDTSFILLFELNDLKIGYLTDRGNFQITDEINASRTFNCMMFISGLRVIQNVASFKLKDSSITTALGFDIGTMDTIGLAGTVATPAKITQSNPVTDIVMHISYDANNKNLNTHLFINFEYRFADIKGVDAAFAADSRKFTSFSSYVIKIGMGVGI